MRKSILLISLALAVAMLWGALRGKADDREHNAYGIDPDLYDRAMASASHGEAEVMAIGDTMYALAQSRGDKKAQLLALNIGTTFYGNAGPQASDKLRKAVEKQCELALATPYKEFYYNGLTTLILHQISYGNYTSAANEVNRMQETAFATSNAYGVGQSHYLMAQLYRSIGMNRAATEELRAGLDYTRQYGEQSDEAKFRYSLLRQYERADIGDSALAYATMLQNSTHATHGQKIYSMLTLASHYREKEQWANLRNQLDQIESLHKHTNFPDDYLSPYLQNLAIYTSHAKGDSAEALQLCQHIRVRRIRFDTEREIYSRHGNYKRACEATRRLRREPSTQNLGFAMANMQAVDALIKNNHLQSQKKQREAENLQLRIARDSMSRIHEQAHLRLYAIEDARRTEEYRNLMTAKANRQIEKERTELQLAEQRSRNAALHANRLQQRLERQRRNMVGIAAVVLLAGFLAIMALRLRAGNAKIKAQKAKIQVKKTQSQMKDRLLLNLRKEVRQAIGEMHDRAVILSGATDTHIASIMQKAIHQRTNTVTSLIDDMIDKATKIGN